MNGAVEPIARNVRHWRITREMTLSALAEQAGVAKSTVSLIERGRGNPSIDTIWSLATALGLPFASLFHDEPRPEDMSVVRGADTAPTTVPGTGGEGLEIRHMLTRTGGALIEIYTVELDDGGEAHSEAHVSGLFEHVTVAAGRVEVNATDFTEVLGEGDLISFRADRPHSYRVLDGPVRLVLVHEYPDLPDA